MSSVRVDVRVCMSGFGAEADIQCSIGDLPVMTPICWAAEGFRSAKALFVPSLKRDIVTRLHTTSGRRGRMAIHIRWRYFLFTLGDAADGAW